MTEAKKTLQKQKAEEKHRYLCTGSEAQRATNQEALVVQNELHESPVQKEIKKVTSNGNHDQAKILSIHQKIIARNALLAGLNPAKSKIISPNKIKAKFDLFANLFAIFDLFAKLDDLFEE